MGGARRAPRPVVIVAGHPFARACSRRVMMSTVNRGCCVVMSLRAKEKRPLDDLLELYGFESLEDFLNAYVAHKKRQNPHWTFGMWSRQMNLANRSSITRILKGERGPGEKMLHLR